MPVGERRKKNNRKYISEQQIEQYLHRFVRCIRSRLCRQAPISAKVAILTKPQTVRVVGIKVVTRELTRPFAEGEFFVFNLVGNASQNALLESWADEHNNGVITPFEYIEKKCQRISQVPFH